MDLGVALKRASLRTQAGKGLSGRGCQHIEGQEFVKGRFGWGARIRT